MDAFYNSILNLLGCLPCEIFIKENILEILYAFREFVLI